MNKQRKGRQTNKQTTYLDRHTNSSLSTNPPARHFLVLLIHQRHNTEVIPQIAYRTSASSHFRDRKTKEMLYRFKGFLARRQNNILKLVPLSVAKSLFRIFLPPSSQV